MPTHRWISGWRLVLGLIVVALTMAGPAFAQTTGAELRGKVVDESGGVLPGTVVSARNLNTGTVWTAVTAAQGQYRVPALGPGPYEIKAELPGFATVIRPRIELVIGQIAEINITMKPATVQGA